MLVELVLVVVVVVVDGKLLISPNGWVSPVILGARSCLTPAKVWGRQLSNRTYLRRLESPELIGTARRTGTTLTALGIEFSRTVVEASLTRHIITL